MTIVLKMSDISIDRNVGDAGIILSQQQKSVKLLL